MFEALIKLLKKIKLKISCICCCKSSCSTTISNNNNTIE